MGKKEKAEARARRRKKRLAKKIVIWVIVLAGVAALVVFFVRSSGKSGTGGSSVVPVTAEDWVKWNPDSPVTLIEYSDFQCPACGSYFPLLNAVGLEFSDEVAFVYRHFPLSQIHFNANAAARAAEAAGKQGKFWEMHDRLFETQELWSSLSAGDAEAVFAGYAKDLLQLDLDQFKADFDSDEVRDKVSADYSGGVSAGVNSTPTFYLNGERVQNPRTADEFGAILRQALDEAAAGSGQ